MTESMVALISSMSSSTRHDDWGCSQHVQPHPDDSQVLADAIVEVRSDLPSFPFLDQRHLRRQDAQFSLVDKKFLLRALALLNLMLKPCVGFCQTVMGLPQLGDHPVELTAENTDFIPAFLKNRRRHVVGIPDGDHATGQVEERPGDDGIHHDHQDYQQEDSCQSYGKQNKFQGIGALLIDRPGDVRFEDEGR